jgi:GNAT superfamily N-acetyltransferase
MTDVTVREATPGDAAALAAAYRSAYAQNRELGFPAKAESATAADVREWIAAAWLYVAVDGDPVGGVRVEPTDDDRVKISRLAVRAERKGEGIGTALLDHAERVARERGYDAAQLTTPPEHPFLPEFYRDRGYEVIGEYPLSYRDYDEVLMEKSLE